MEKERTNALILYAALNIIPYALSVVEHFLPSAGWALPAARMLLMPVMPFACSLIYGIRRGPDRLLPALTAIVALPGLLVVRFIGFIDGGISEFFGSGAALLGFLLGFIIVGGILALASFAGNAVGKKIYKKRQDGRP